MYTLKCSLFGSFLLYWNDNSLLLLVHKGFFAKWRCEVLGWLKQNRWQFWPHLIVDILSALHLSYKVLWLKQRINKSNLFFAKFLGHFHQWILIVVFRIVLSWFVCFYNTNDKMFARKKAKLFVLNALVISLDI